MRNRITLVQSTDRNMNQLQQNINEAMQPLLQNALLNGQLLANVKLLSGPNIINHGLGRVLQGWLIVRQRAAGTVYDLQDANTQPALTLALTASANTNVDLYVY